MTEDSDLLAQFETGRIDPAQFPHRAHVRVGFELLERHRFPEALLHLARGLRRLAARAGHPEAYHETITTAFLALIAERRLRSRDNGWSEFAAQNADLFRKDLLEEFYDTSVLQSLQARNTFILPRKKDPPAPARARTSPAITSTNTITSRSRN